MCIKKLSRYVPISKYHNQCYEYSKTNRSFRGNVNESENIILVMGVLKGNLMKMLVGFLIITR